MNIPFTSSLPNKPEVDTDYGWAFGLDADKGQHMIYKGGNTWEGVNGAVEPVQLSLKSALRVLGA